MNCKEFSKYLVYGLSESKPHLPADAEQHLQNCPHCQAQLKELGSAFALQRQKVSESVSQQDESLGRIWANIQQRLKSDDLPDAFDIDCQLVQPYLGQVADPLEMAVPPAWLEEHIDERGYLLDSTSHYLLWLTNKWNGTGSTCTACCARR